jgi:hypothetical protein
LKDLLALKQQQAGVVEAREAVKQGEETLRQGRSIMLFTIVTIVFVSFHPLTPRRRIKLYLRQELTGVQLPLSFFTGIFGMNAIELTGSTGDYHFRDIFVYMGKLKLLQP